MPKIGLGLSGEQSFHESRELCMRAEKCGFDSVWYPEEFLWRDALCSLGAIATCTSRISLGTAVVSPYTRNLALLAMSIRTLDEISRGRLTVGIGSGTRFWKTLGIRDKHPIATIRDSVSVLRRLLDGKQVSHMDQNMRLRRARFNFSGRRDIPIYVGPIGPRMLELSGKVGDGAILSEGASPEYVTYAVKRLRRGLSHSKRTKKDFEIASYVICWRQDRGELRLRIKESLAAMLSVPGREILFREKDIDMDRIAAIRKWYWRGELQHAGRLVDEEMVSSMTISGDKRTMRNRAEEYVESGVTHLIVTPCGYKPEDLMDTFSSLSS